MFLLVTQKCRIVNLRHEREIADYLERKRLYKQFETEEVFKKNIPVEEHLETTLENARLGAQIGTSNGMPHYDRYLQNERGVKYTGERIVMPHKVDT